jgi:ribonucleoside-triphosphate reductase (thioredoxin)
MDQYQQFIHKSRYARWMPEEKRRERWDETVNRYVNFWVDRGQLDDKTALKLFNAIHNLDVMPSMRCMMTAGPALAKDNVAGFNCSYLHIDSPRSFDELMYVLMCGTGVGFSVERNFINKLPVVAETFHPTDSVIVVSDSKIGWASAFRELISLLYAGKIPKWDMHKIRPAGARLKTFGGRASGPDPLIDLFNFCVGMFQKSAGT